MAQTAEEVNEEFKGKLFALLREYRAEMQVEEDSSGWERVVTGVNFFAYDEYDADGNAIPGVNVTLGAWEDGEVKAHD